MFSADICSSTVCHLSLCAGALLACCVLIVGVAIISQSHSTPLSIMTDHFSNFKSKAQNLSVLVKKSKLRTLCSSEWPIFQVGWPPEGTFGLPVIRAVKKRIMAPDPRGHPDQAPYILVWENLVEGPPVWLKPFIHNPPSASVPQAVVLEASKEEDWEARESRKKPILQESSLYPSLIDLNAEISPPPYSPPPLLLQVPQVSSGEQRGTQNPRSAAGGGPARGTCGRTPGGGDSSDFGSREAPSSTVRAFPVRVGPANPDGERTYQYWPVSTSDLYNWKAQNPSFSEKPQGLIGLLDTILFTQSYLG